MIDPRVALVGLAILLACIGVKKAAHGVNVAAHDVKHHIFHVPKAVGHTVHHLVRHPVDSIENGAARK